MTVPARNLHRPLIVGSRTKRVEPLEFAATVRQRLTLAQWLFLFIVVLPTAISAIYLGLIGSDRYVSEATFIVRGTSSNSSGGLTALIRSIGFSRADDDTYAVQDFIKSREAVRLLDERMPLREVFSRPGTDWFSRFPAFWRRNTFEAMYNYFQDRVKIVLGASNGITQLRVAAFRPDDSRDLALNLLRLSEELVNRINERAQRDAIAHAQSELERAEAKVIAAQAEITNFRNRELIIDPTSNSAKALEIIGRLTAELAQTKTQLQETLTSAPLNPAIPALRVRATTLQDQIAAEQYKMAGRDGALASKISAYERLVLSREFADRELTLAATALELARQEARRQHIYIETISPPNLPDESIEPRRWRGFFTTLIFSIAIFAMVWFFMIGAREQLHG